MKVRPDKPQYRDQFARYFQDELGYLRELGTEYSRQDPGRAHFDFANVDDPDVKCLLEGFSFLTARIRQQLDGDLPELSHSLVQILYPHYLRPTPPMTVLEFSPKAGALSARTRIARGAVVKGPVVEGTQPTFRTTMPVDVLPIEIGSVQLERRDGRRGAIAIELRSVGEADLAAIDLSSLRFYVRGEAEDARRVLSLIRTRATATTLSLADRAGVIRRDADDALARVGFDLEAPEPESTSLLPWPARSFDGYRLLQEYFAYPKAFSFIDVMPVGHEDQIGARLGDEPILTLTLRIELEDAPADLPRIDSGSFGLNCAPAINLFPCDADPILLDHQRPEVLVRPEGEGRRHFEIFAIEKVDLLGQGAAEVPHFHSFQASRSSAPGAPMFYESRLRPSTLKGEGGVKGPSTDTYLRFVNGDGAPFAAGAESVDELLPPEARLSVSLLCTNRHLAERVTPGSLTMGGDGVPPSVTVRGIEPISRTVSPPMGDNTQWKLLSHLSLNSVSLDDVDRLRGLLEIYDVQFQGDDQARLGAQRRLDALRKLTQKTETSLYRGAAVSVVATTVDVDLDGFLGVGDLDLFGMVLSEFLRSYVAMNALSRLTVRVPSTGMVLTYPARAGFEALA